MRWVQSHRADADVVPLADRHYNRQKIGSPQFAPPGRCLVLKTAAADAFWITSYPFAEYVKHAWAGAWVCSAFRNESEYRSSELIREAVAVSRFKWETPALGMVTFVNADKVRRKRDPGRCFLRAGFRPCGKTKGGLLAFQMLPADMPKPAFMARPGDLFDYQIAEFMGGPIDAQAMRKSDTTLRSMAGTPFDAPPLPWIIG
jgi:hypothetical protein